MFCDWRQLPLASDAIQAGGFVWRGIIAWDKGPSLSRTKATLAQGYCWGTSGVSVPDTHSGPYPGCYQVPIRLDDKHHLTGKPTNCCASWFNVCRSTRSSPITSLAA